MKDLVVKKHNLNNICEANICKDGVTGVRIRGHSNQKLSPGIITGNTDQMQNDEIISLCILKYVLSRGRVCGSFEKGLTS